MKTPAASLVRSVTALALLIAWTTAAVAHDRKTAGAITLVVGWANEPAYTGALNAIVVALTDGKAPLPKAEGQLSAEVIFGNERITLPLEQRPGRPHEFQAALVPTRAGSYAFRVTGTINKQAIDISSTCSDATFHCVEDASAIQFPIKDPTIGQLTERIDRALPRATAAGTATANAATVSLIALAAAIGAMLIAAFAVFTAQRNAK